VKESKRWVRSKKDEMRRDNEMISNIGGEGG